MSEDPEAIWLSPACDSDTPDGRLWANPAPEDCCDDCGDPWVKYVRADLATPPDTQGAGYGGLVERLRESARDASRIEHEIDGGYPRPPRLFIQWEAAVAIQTLTAENDNLAAAMRHIGRNAEARITTLEEKLARAVEALGVISGPPERDPDLPSIYQPRWSSRQCRDIARQALTDLSEPPRSLSAAQGEG